MARPLTPAQRRLQDAQEKARLANEAVERIRKEQKEDEKERSARLRHHLGSLVLEWAKSDLAIRKRIHEELPAHLTKEDHRRGIWYLLFDEGPPKPAAQEHLSEAAQVPRSSTLEDASLGDDQGPADHHQAPSALPHEHDPEHHPR